MRPHGTFAATLTMSLLLLAAAGCGGGDDDPGGDDGGPTGPPAPPSPPPPGSLSLRVAAGGDNVPDRYTSDLWVHGSRAYTGTWGGSAREGNVGDALKIWSLSGGGAPSLEDSIIVPGVFTISDVEVSADGLVLMFSAELGADEGLYLYDLTDPADPAFLDNVQVPNGLHTAFTTPMCGTAWRSSSPGTPA